jgi:hypothetical protein
VNLIPKAAGTAVLEGPGAPTIGPPVIRPRRESESRVSARRTRVTALGTEPSNHGLEDAGRVPGLVIGGCGFGEGSVILQERCSRGTCTDYDR